MSFCDDLAEWDDLPPSGRFERVSDWMQRSAADAGFDPDLKIKNESPPGYPDRRGGYDPDTNTIYLNPDLFENDRDGGWKYAFDTAAHEFTHHVQDKVDNAYGEPVEVDEGDDGEEDQSESGDEEVEDLHDDDRHAEAQDFAETFLDLAEEACEDDPDGAESALRSFLEDWLSIRDTEPSPVGDWNLPPGGIGYG